MTHVTFETALKLRGIGFSQPLPKLGQKWYCETTENHGWIRLVAGELFTLTGEFPEPLADFCVYAPTLEELLTWKPRIEAIDPLTLTVQPCNHGGFAAGYLPAGNRENCVFYQAESAAEAAAKAILNTNWAAKAL